MQGGTLRWTRGGVEDVVGVGIYVEDAEADLTDVNVVRAYQGIQPTPAYGIVAKSSRVSTMSSGVSQIEGVAFLASDATGDHAGLMVSECDLGGVWLLGASDMTLTDATLRGNGVVGIVAAEGASLTLTDSLVEATTTQLAEASVDPTAEAGDGIQIEGAARVTLENVELVDNERVGMLLDETGATTTLELTAVDIRGEGLGAIAQEGATVMPLTSAEVTRSADMMTRDEASMERLETTSELDPAALPAP